MKKVLATIVMLCSLAAIAVAQEAAPAGDANQGNASVGEFRYSLAVGSGVSGFNINDDGVSGTPELGGTYGVDFGVSTFFSKHWGIHFGLGFTASSGSYDYDNFVCQSTYKVLGHVVDYTTELVDPRYDFQDYMLTVPLQVAFRATHWYANFGFKMGFSLSSEADFSINDATTSAYDHTTGTSINSASPVAATMGCEDSGLLTVSQNNVFGHTCRILAAIETGYRIEASPCCALTIGVYGEYALNKYFFDADGLTMVQENDKVSKSFDIVAVDKLRNFNAGLRLTVDFGSAK